MPKFTRAFFAAALAMALAAFFAETAPAQTKGSGSGKIVCWKDKSGKVVGCGDKVPPEYEDSATKELDRRGVTRKTTETAEEQARRAAEDQQLAKQKAEEKKRLDEQRRRDSALLNTYASEMEIDQRRDRELQEVDRVLGQFQGLHKGAVARRDDAQKRLEASEKAKKPSDAIKDELARAEADMAKIEKSINAKNKEKEEIRARYAETKQRYMELRGSSAQSAAAPAAPAKK
jgi:DNA repair exonuclease SbcCD ATPase subunit